MFTGGTSACKIIVKPNDEKTASKPGCPGCGITLWLRGVITSHLMTPLGGDDLLVQLHDLLTVPS